MGTFLAEFVLTYVPSSVLMIASFLNSLIFIYRYFARLTTSSRDTMLVMSLACFVYGFSYVVVTLVEQPLTVYLQATLRVSYLIMCLGLLSENISATSPDIKRVYAWAKRRTLSYFQHLPHSP